MSLSDALPTLKMAPVDASLASLADLPRIERYILEQVHQHPRDVAKIAAEEFKVSRQAANRHLRRLVGQGFLLREGKTRGAAYRLARLRHLKKTLPITATLAEDEVWINDVAPVLHDVRVNVRDICRFGFTEMVNNAIDHSGSARVTISVEVSAANIRLSVVDEGVGIFRKIKESCGLNDEKHAIFELTKGKLTTDPERHTGEGIFFTSRIFDRFSLMSSVLSLGCKYGGSDWLLESSEAIPGTTVTMDISPSAHQTLPEVFDRYATEQDDYAFQKTHVVAKLVDTETDKLVSRSQAKRILARLERFKEIVLDFEGIDWIAPAFADEVFRVFAKQHPGIRITTVNTNEAVGRMIRRAEANSPEMPGTRSGPETGAEAGGN